jgi:hypothetical protein
MVRFRSSSLALSAWCIVASASAGGWDDALARIPADAASVVAIPNIKAASDDLQQAIDRMGRAEAALGGRPIDLLKAQLGIGPGIDDRGALLAWSVPSAAGMHHVLALPVTDGQAFMSASLKPHPTEAGAFEAPGVDAPVWARVDGSFVLLSDHADGLGAVGAIAADRGFAGVLVGRLGARGTEIMRAADAVAWASSAALARAPADPRAAPYVGQIADAMIAVDFDALAVGFRAFARFDPASEVAKAMPSGERSPRAPASLLDRLPAAVFYGAVGVDLAGMGGAAHVRSFMERLPGAEQVSLPPWLDAVQDKVSAVQVAAYPSRLGLVSAGILNDAALVVVTDDPAAVRGALRSWVESQVGEAEGIRREPTWEDARTLKDGSTVTAFAVKETVVGQVGSATERIMRQLLISARGLHGFVREVPGALVVTYSQRTDVLARATAAATPGAEKTLATNAVVRAMQAWLVPDADAVAFIGVAPLLDAARQVADAVPGMADAAIPAAPPGTEPVAMAVRSRDGQWEAALVVPAGVMAIGFDAMKAQLQP